jgi:hypothetical protein
MPVSAQTVVTHGEESDLPQSPGADEWWQDSAFLSWYDAAAGVSGIFRIGHEPNYSGGTVAVWFGVMTADGVRYRRNCAVALESADRLENGFGGLGGRYRTFYDNGVRYRVEDDDCRAELIVEDFYPRTDFFSARQGSLGEEFASRHFETSGRIRGSIDVAGQRYEIDGLCHRDRSWGIRHWNTVLNSRWIPGTFGPELSFGALVWHAVDGSIGRFGFVVRNGQVTLADALDIAVVIEPDGATYRGASVTWTLPDSKLLAFSCEPNDALVFEHHGFVTVHGPASVSLDGARGFCGLAVVTNPRGGTGPLTATLRAGNVEGLSTR